MPRARVERPPSVFDYDDFRAYLRDYYAHQKRLNPRFSYGIFAKRAGLTSRGHLKVIIDGIRNLTPEWAEKYVRGLGLEGRAAEYFHVLVKACQARDPAERGVLRADMNRLRFQREQRVMSPNESSLFNSQWHAMVVLSMTGVQGFRPDPRWISRRTAGRISPAEAALALSALRDSGHLVVRKGRMISSTPESILTFAEGAFLRVHEKALRDALETLPMRRGFGDSTIFLFALTREEAADLAAKHWKWLQGNLPTRKGNEQVKGELCVVLGDVFPLTFPGRR